MALNVGYFILYGPKLCIEMQCTVCRWVYNTHLQPPVPALWMIPCVDRTHGSFWGPQGETESRDLVSSCVTPLTAVSGVNRTRERGKLSNTAASVSCRGLCHLHRASWRKGYCTTANDASLAVASSLPLRPECEVQICGTSHRFVVYIEGSGHGSELQMNKLPLSLLLRVQRFTR